MSDSAYDHKWSPIADLPADFAGWACSELPHLRTIWEEQRQHLDAAEVKTFNDRLARTWAIETGILENIYQLDRGMTMLLVEHGFNATLISHDGTDIAPQSLIDIVTAHRDSLENVFSFASGNRSFSTSFIRELHQQLLTRQETVLAKVPDGRLVERAMLKGEYKKLPNNPMIPEKGLHQYCPPEQVASEMDALVALHGRHEAEGVPVEISAAWLHHRFMQIHPFEDGNGRVARAIASLVFIKGGLFPLLIVREDRDAYLDALGQADAGDLRPLVNLFSLTQRRCLLRALSISQDVLSSRRNVANLIQAASERISTRRRMDLDAKVKQLDNVVSSLLDLTRNKLDEIARQLEEVFRKGDERYRAKMDFCPVDGERKHYYRRQIIDIARQPGYDYFANLRESTAWVCLSIFSPDKTKLVFSFHGVGQRVSGAGACMAFIEEGSTEEDDGERVVGSVTAKAAASEPFQYTCLSSTNELAEPFGRWLDEAIIVMLDHWRRQL